MGNRRLRGGPKLPVQQLSILAICRFAEPVAMTSVFPYLPEMIESFGIPKSDVAFYTGITSAVFSLSQCLTAILWGRASDTFGRKPAILAGLSFTMMSTLIWGLSSSLPMAITARAFAGGCNGNVGIIRTMVAEMVPEKELQPRAFSIMPLIWSMGSIFGPSIGGFFAKPVDNLPGLFGDSKLFAKFPFLLPNLVASSLFLIGISTGILFLKETLESRKHKQDWGRALGSRIMVAIKASFKLHKPLSSRRRKELHAEQSASLLHSTSSANLESPTAPKWSSQFSEPPKSPPLPPPTLREVFTTQSAINLVAYTFLALHSVAYDQLLPNLLHLPRNTSPEDNHLPFKFSGGFGLNSSRIGTLFTLYGICGCIVQFLIFPPVARYYGILNCFKACALSFPVICVLTPYTALITSPFNQQAALVLIMIAKSFAVIFAFPCSMILLTNSASSLRILGTLNGIAVSVSAVGRALGPAITGAAFSWGQKRGYGITPWFLLSVISSIGAIPIWWLVEMEGFSKSDDRDDDGDADDEDEGDEDLLPPLTASEILDGDERIEYDEFEEAIDTVTGPSLAETGRRSSGARKNSGTLTRLERRMSNPIGMIGGGVGPGGPRKLSNGLAVSGTGQGVGGTSFS